MNPKPSLSILLLLFAFLLEQSAALHAEDAAGPKTPNILWVYRSSEHFVASPAAVDKILFVSGLGAFDTGILHALSVDPAAPQRELWTKSPPYLKMPTVSAPAVVDGKIIFGDGMHQTDGGTLHCLQAATGRALWQFPLRGQLIHMEGSPAVAGGKVYMGGGNAGVFCIDPSRVTLDGKEQDQADVQASLDARWREMLAKYEEDKKKDPDFAIPPSEDSLPKPIPKLVWQQGKNQWHVDASVAVAGDRVLACSAYLDDEKTGERALLCLKAGDGEVLWKTPLPWNPWAGPVIAEKTVLVGCSSVRFDPQTLTGAKGEVIAANLESGRVLWRKELPGGVLARLAVRAGVAVACATDGKVRAFELASGKELWTYDAAAPLFAGPAVAGDTVYCADLKGVIHAVNRTDGKKLWTLDMATDPAVKLSGMVYGTPLLHEGRLYVATCSLGAESTERQGHCVVCIGDK